jgi:copper(I)-binding protein
MKLAKQIILAAALSLAAFWTAAADAKDFTLGKIVIHTPWIKLAPGSSDFGAAYAAIENTGSEDDVLVKVAVDGVPMVQMHEMKMEGDVMKMVEMKDGLSLPVGETVELRPKSSHIMLMGLQARFKPGDNIKGTLTFAKAGVAAVDFEVVAPGADAPQGD